MGREPKSPQIRLREQLNEYRFFQMKQVKIKNYLLKLRADIRRTNKEIGGLI